jgi:hypothetical protein
MKKLYLGINLLAGTVAALTFVGCASSTIGPNTTPTGFTKVYGTGYTLDTNQGLLLGFSFTKNTVTPILNVTAPTLTDTRSYFDGVAVDASGNLYAVLRNFNNDTQVSTCSIAKYSATAGTGTATPLASFSSSTLCSVNPTYLGMDSAGNFYVVGGGGTAKFAANSMGMTGDVTPSVRIQGAYADETGAAYVDQAGNLYATPFNQSPRSDSVAFYAAGFNANTVPVTFVPATPSFINAVWVDGAGKIYLVDQNVSSGAISVDVYPAGATSATPTRSISGAMTSLGYPTGLATDANGTIYVLDGTSASEQAIVSSNDSLVVREYASSLSGNVPATATATTTLAYEYGSNFILQ